MLNNKIEWQVATPPQAYDGSKLNYSIGYDPFDMGSISPAGLSIWDVNKKCLYFGREAVKYSEFRLPRKLKKKVKQRIGINERISRRDLRFNYDVFKTYRYYGCKILKELPKETVSGYRFKSFDALNEVIKANMTFDYKKTFEAPSEVDAKRMFDELVSAHNRFFKF